MPTIKQKLLVVLGVIVIVAGVAYAVWQNYEPGKLDGFTQCLKEKGATFYGAFWCPHCQSQKKLFGNSQKYLPYVECSTPDGSAQNQTCKEKNIPGYPTWEFADKSRLNREVALNELSEKTGCALPNN